METREKNEMNTETKTASRERGTAVATRVSDAYMTGLYGEREWAKVGRWLAGLGFDDRKIETILRSKYMRWASDHMNGTCTCAGFKSFWANCPTLTTPKAIKGLVD